MKMLGYTGETERNFDVSPGLILGGVRNFGSNGENDEKAGKGDAGPIDQGVNSSYLRRVQLSMGLDGSSAIDGSERAKTASAPGYESSRALNTLGHRIEPPMGHRREFGKRSYV